MEIIPESEDTTRAPNVTESTDILPRTCEVVYDGSANVLPRACEHNCDQGVRAQTHLQRVMLEKFVRNG